MANLKHIEFTTEAKYQSKVKSDDTLYAVPFTGGGGGGGTTLNKYNVSNLDLTTTAGRSKLYRILDGAKSLFVAYVRISNGIGSGFSDIYGGGNGGVQNNWGYFSATGYENTNKLIMTYSIMFGSNGSLNGYACVTTINTQTNECNVVQTPSTALISLTYYNDTEIV